MFVYQLDIRNLRETWYFFFARKKCPGCGGKLYRVDTRTEHSREWERDGLQFEYVHVIKDPVRYRCDPCHAYYSLQSLAAPGGRHD